MSGWHWKIVEIYFKWEPRDIWIGVYWNRLNAGCYDVYVCFLPCVPLYIRVEWRYL